MKEETQALVDEFLEKGGRITFCYTVEPPKKVTVRVKKKNKDCSMYNYSDMEFPAPLDFWSN
jgi:hypothetical protein